MKSTTVLWLIKLSTVYLLVTGAVVSPSPPSITKQPPSNFFHFNVRDTTKNETIIPFKLDCEATGEPEPKYKWLKNSEIFQLHSSNDRVIYQSPHKGTLVFNGMIEEDEGLYQCFVENSFGVAVSNKVSLRKWKKIVFPSFTTKIVKDANRGEPVTLDCGSLTVFPRENIYWLLMSSNGLLTPINDSRILTDPEGRLHFSNITIFDALENTYCCSTFTNYENTVIVDTECKQEFKIRIVGTSPTIFNHEPIEQYISPINTVGLKDDNLDLYCIFGGTPLPGIQWAKKNGDLPLGRHEILNHGKILRLKNIELEDEGSYECKASNGIGDIHYGTIHVEVQARPFWMSEPYNILTSEDENVEFTCNAEGIPKPEVEWFVNGIALTDAPSNPRRTVINSTMIRIDKLEISDTAVYQCNASNSLGYVFKNFYVNVLDIIPVILKTPKVNYEAVDGSSVILPCKVIGAPKPTVEWKLNGTYFNDDRRNVLENGDLKIERLTFIDAGTYSCIATNKYGWTESENLTLDVLERVRIIYEPQDLELFAGTFALFRCQVVADKSLALDMDMDWLFNGQPISFDDNPNMFRAADHTLSISKISREYSGTYTCVVSTRLESVSANATLTVIDVPNQPQIVTTKCRGSTVHIKWESQNNDRAPILAYEIQYNTSFEPDSWQDYFDYLKPTDLQTTTFLSPWINCSFRILAKNKVGLSAPSAPSKTCSSPKDNPHKNPDNVRAKGTSPTNLVISWDPMPPIEHNAPGFFYRIYYRLDSDEIKWAVPIEIYNWTESSYEIQNTGTFQPYRIKVSAHNEMGDAIVNPVEIIGYSGEDVPSEAPSNFSLLRVIDGYSAIFSWDPVPLESVRGHLKEYKVEMWTTSEDDKWKYTIPPDLTRVRLSELKPFATNHVRLRVVNGKYEGPPTSVISLQTPEEKPGPVSRVDAIAVGSRSLFMEWEKPHAPNGVITGYLISYAKVEKSQIGTTLDLPIINPNQRRFKISGLQTNMKYRVSVSAKTSRGFGVPYFVEKSTAEQSESPAKSTFSWEIISTAHETSSIRITWLPANYQFVGNEFKVKYKKKGDIAWEYTDEESESDTQIVSLDSGLYEIAIVTSDDEYSTTSDIQEIEIANWLLKLNL